jgi:hypothetical protein
LHNCNWQPPEIVGKTDNSEGRSFHSPQFGVIFDSDSEDDFADDGDDFGSEGSATEILGDSQQLPTGIPIQTDFSKQELVTCTKEKLSFQERRERFAVAHPLDFSSIKSCNESVTTENRKRHTSTLGEPNCFFIFQNNSGSNTPSVQQYVKRLEQIGKEITRMYGEEFERVLSKLSIVDLSYSAFKVTAQGLVGAGSMTKDKIWKLIGFGQTAVGMVPENQPALKQNFEKYTAAVVEEVAEEWIEENGGWGAMLEETEAEVEDKEESQANGHFKATDWEDFLEHVGKVLQSEEGTSVSVESRKRKRHVSSEELDELLQHVKKSLHGFGSDSSLDDFMAHVNSTLQGHMADDSEIDSMLHQFRRSLLKQQRVSKLSSSSSASGDLSKLDTLSPIIESSEVDGELKPDQVSVAPLPTTLQNEGKENDINRLDKKLSVYTRPIKDDPQRTTDISDRHPTREQDALKHSDANQNWELNTDQSGLWFHITQLSLVFALGVAVGMLVMKYVI